LAGYGGFWRTDGVKRDVPALLLSIIANHQVVIVDHKHKLRFIKIQSKVKHTTITSCLCNLVQQSLKNNLIAEEFATQSAQGPKLSTP
jgi:hypothetical protein